LFRRWRDAPSAPMISSQQRKTVLILSLALSLAVALIAITAQEDLREKLGSVFYVIGFAIIGCVLLVLAGYVWDRSLMERLKTLREAGTPSEKRTPPTREESDPDEILGLARNIERMARSLQQVEASYRNMVEDQVDLICRYRPDGRITFVNGAYARAFAKKRLELSGELFPFYSHGVAVGDGPFTFERELVLPDNRRRWLLWIQRPIGDANGIVEYQALGHDITERKEAEAALIKAKNAAESADRAKSEFLAIVSHELCTPINGVIGFAKLLTESPLNPEQREFVTMIQTGGRALERLIADILDLSRIEAGNIEIEKTPSPCTSALPNPAPCSRPKHARRD